MWSHHKSSDWYLRLHFADYVENSNTNSSTDVSSFLQLILKIMVLKVFHLLRDGTILVHQRPISMVSLQMSTSHSFTEWEKQNLSKTPKSESVPHVAPSDHGSAAHTTPGHIETTSPHTLEPQTTSTQLRQSSSHVDRLTILVKGLHECISGLSNAIYSTNN